MLVVIRLKARIVLNPLIVLNQLGRYAIRQIGRNMIKDAGPEMPNPHKDLEIRDR
jgi:hypothetical protein